MQFIFKNLYLFSRFFQKPEQTNYGVKPVEIAELISFRIVCTQRTLMELKPFIYSNSTVYVIVFLTLTSALFFPLR